ncbi:helix-turn-helix domain-containing protein [Actinocorallia longicatena]|uniref:PucR family transcriptional regulator n=1 Tax=Actinocorallia longicatena TaxID=111803 RepID=A0ABP6Q6R1_9ACTN
MTKSQNEAADPDPERMEIAALLLPVLPDLAVEIIDEIREQVPEFTVVLAGEHGEPVRAGIAKALHQLLAQFNAGMPVGDLNARFFHSLGRGEYRESRSLDALQAAYRIAGRTAWRRFAEVGQDSGVAPARMYQLADAVFGFTDEMSALSVRAFTELSGQDNVLERTRQRLLQLLLVEPGPTMRTRLADLSHKARWPLPGQVACVAISEDYATRFAIPPALDEDILADLDRSDPCLMIPGEPSAARFGTLHRSLQGVRFALGPTVALEESASSLRLARQALIMLSDGALSGEEHIRCEDHLVAMHLLNDELCMRVLSERALAPFAELTPDQGDRLCETLLAWLGAGSSVLGVAELLHVHPQTVRYRIRRLTDMFPGRLNDPDWRFEMLLVLRARQLGQRPPSRPRRKGPSRWRPKAASATLHR